MLNLVKNKMKLKNGFKEVNSFKNKLIFLKKELINYRDKT